MALTSVVVGSNLALDTVGVLRPVQQPMSYSDRSSEFSLVAAPGSPKTRNNTPVGFNISISNSFDICTILFTEIFISDHNEIWD